MILVSKIGVAHLHAWSFTLAKQRVTRRKISRVICMSNLMDIKVTALISCRNCLVCTHHLLLARSLPKDASTFLPHSLKLLRLGKFCDQDQEHPPVARCYPITPSAILQ